MQEGWENKISSVSQLGGIETSVLDSGSGRGVRIAWVNTGSGLRYKVVLDRAMDIADTFFNSHCLSWINETGITPPQPFSDKGIDWLRTFGGGLLVTCGLSHIGGPESDEYGERGLHGRISNIPAEIISIQQPDPFRGEMDMSITGRIRETSVFGPRLELKRTISSRLGQPVIRIKDEVTNNGNQSTPHMLLYHFNFGWPLANEGADILWHGNWQARDENSRLIFNEKNNFHKCPPVMKEHNGAGEAAAFIDCTANDKGWCVCGLYNSGLELAVALRFQKQQLPWLANWQHWGEREYVTGLEPGANKVIGQKKAREEGSLIILQPGEARCYELELEVMCDSDKIESFMQQYK
ncbi:aldose 1-epimerase family protein [Parafilimonas sp.]|uniref:aldose 1-epimerase family protein n=1 Tax=Parafilimonas sp. TaxID=1969739 RepID=UPI0039E5DDD7